MSAEKMSSLPPFELPEISAELISRYSRVSGDYNPIHTDRHAAERCGYPDTIAHGMLVMGLAGHALEAWFPGRKLSRWDAKFVSFVLPGERLYVLGERTLLSGDNSDCGINGTWKVIDGKDRTKLSGRFAFK